MEKRQKIIHGIIALVVIAVLVFVFINYTLVKKAPEKTQTCESINTQYVKNSELKS